MGGGGLALTAVCLCCEGHKSISCDTRVLLFTSARNVGGQWSVSKRFFSSFLCQDSLLSFKKGLFQIVDVALFLTSHGIISWTTFKLCNILLKLLLFLFKSTQARDIPGFVSVPVCPDLKKKKTSLYVMFNNMWTSNYIAYTVSGKY
mmetsp:Transcript_19533/g.34282  ORF Transcript_19533/g.34282 Transcript_19533/m.34282 type:complete len:147 (+) Transcript_19533:496-936(+)